MTEADEGGEAPCFAHLFDEAEPAPDDATPTVVEQRDRPWVFTEMPELLTISHPDASEPPRRNDGASGPWAR